MSDSTTQLTTACQASLSFTISWSLLKLCPLSQWCHPNISSSVAHFSCSQSFPASESFLMSWLLTSGGQSIGAPASASVLPVNIQCWFPLGFTGLTLLLSRIFSRVLWHHNSKASIIWHSAFFIVQLSHPYMTTGKIIAIDQTDLC